MLGASCLLEKRIRSGVEGLHLCFLSYVLFVADYHIWRMVIMGQRVRRTKCLRECVNIKVSARRRPATSSTMCMS